MKCRYLSGIKNETYQSTCEFTLQRIRRINNFMKKKTKKKTFNQIWIRDPCNHRGVWSRVPLVVCPCSPSVAMTASEKRRSNIVFTLPSWCTWGLYGNQNGIKWLWRTIRANQWDNGERQKKKQDKDQITNYASCHFYSCFAKNVCVCFMFACFPCLPLSNCLCKPVMTVCCRCIGCTGGKNMNAFFFSRTLTDF